jgi:hypothetical protein
MVPKEIHEGPHPLFLVDFLLLNYRGLLKVAGSRLNVHAERSLVPVHFGFPSIGSPPSAVPDFPWIGSPPFNP